MISERTLGSFAAVAGLVALMACVPGGTATTVRNIDQDPLYSQGLLRWIAASETGLVMRVTAPDGDTRWADHVKEALASLDWLPFADLAIDRTGSANAVFHLLAVIDAPVGVSADRACAGGIGKQALKPENGRSHILLALCHGGRSVATARTVAATEVSPGSPELADAVRAGAIQAFPLHDPDGPDGMFQLIIVFP